jgi:hypothetical protein
MGDEKSLGEVDPPCYSSANIGRHNSPRIALNSYKWSDRAMSKGSKHKKKIRKCEKASSVLCRSWVLKMVQDKLRILWHGADKH